MTLLDFAYKFFIWNFDKFHLEALLYCCTIQCILSVCHTMKLSAFISFFNSNNHLEMGN